jgi:hypothetical protein
VAAPPAAHWVASSAGSAAPELEALAVSVRSLLGAALFAETTPTIRARPSLDITGR